MTIKKTLTGIVLTGALALSGVGCGNNPEYHFDGEIDKERVYFYEAKFFEGNFGSNYLEVVRENGTKIEYTDHDDDFKLDYIRIKKDGESIYYESDVIGENVMKEGQLQFDNYLKKIREFKQAKGLKDIGK